MCIILSLPDELIVCIAAQLPSNRDADSFPRTNRRLFACVGDYLYHYDARKSSCRALDWAVEHRVEQTARKAIEVGATTTIEMLRTPCGLTERDHSMTKLLLDLGEFAIGLKDEHDRTPLWYAVGVGHDSYIKQQLNSEKADFGARDAFGETLLSRAAYAGHESTVALLLECNRVEADTSNQNDETALTFDVRNGHEGVVRLLLESGRVDINSRENRGVLGTAAFQGRRSTAKLILDFNPIDCNLIDGSGMPPLSQDIAQGHEAVAKLLVDSAGVDVDFKDRVGRTPLWYAVHGSHNAIAEVLLDTGEVDLYLKDHCGNSLLSLAEHNCHMPTIQLLLRYCVHKY